MQIFKRYSIGPFWTTTLPGNSDDALIVYKHKACVVIRFYSAVTGKLHLSYRFTKVKMSSIEMKI